MREIIIGNIVYILVIMGMLAILIMDYKRYKKDKLKSQKEKLLFNRFWDTYFKNGGEL